MAQHLINCLLSTASLVLLLPGVALAQTYSSGSTGANGAFPPAVLPTNTSCITMNLGTGAITYFDLDSGNNNCSTQLGTATVGAPSSAGVFNFTTFQLPSSTVLYFIPDGLNRPLQFLASGTVTLDGILDAGGSDGAPGDSFLNGVGGRGGPGGFTGGNGSPSGFGAPGAGPSGGVGQIGSASADGGALVVGSTPLTPLFGGSGGGGSLGTANRGGGGGGAVLIASSGTITINAFSGIRSHGGDTGSSAGGGSGGAVRLLATSLVGGGSIDVSGGNGAQPGRGGAVRLEAFTNTFANVYYATLATKSLTPTPPFPTGLPSIRIVSIGGVTAPVGGTGGAVNPQEIVFGTPQIAPVTITLASTNVPANTAFVVRLSALNGVQSNQGNVTTATGNLDSAGNGSVQLVLPGGTSVLDVLASYTVASSGSQPESIPIEVRTQAKGEPIERIEVASSTAGRSEIVYVTRSGRRLTAVANAR